MAQLYRLAELFPSRAQAATGTAQPAPRNSSLVEKPRVLKTLRDIREERGRASDGVEQVKRFRLQAPGFDVVRVVKRSIRQW